MDNIWNNVPAPPQTGAAEAPSSGLRLLSGHQQSSLLGGASGD